MKKIPVVNTDLFVLVDDEDYELANQYRWYRGYSRKHGKIVSIQTKIGRKTIYIHRLVTNAPDDKFVDHINGDVLDNRKENLRFCNNQMNSFNRSSTNPLGYKGVYKRNDKKYTRERYRAYINIDYKRINLGTFDTPEEAAMAYNKAAMEHHGEFARLNVIEGS